MRYCKKRRQPSTYCTLNTCWLLWPLLFMSLSTQPGGILLLPNLPEATVPQDYADCTLVTDEHFVQPEGEILG